jgi:hypothetical protein
LPSFFPSIDFAAEELENEGKKVVQIRVMGGFLKVNESFAKRLDAATERQTTAEAAIPCPTAPRKSGFRSE